MAVEIRAKVPDSCIQDTWEVEKGTISLADNSSQTILEQYELNLNWQNPLFIMILVF